MNTKTKQKIADKMHEIVIGIQVFVDSVTTDSAESEEMEALLLAQSDLNAAHEEITGKPVF